MGALVRDRLMPVAPTPVRNRRQRAGVTVLCRYLPHHILACPRLAPDVGEAEEGERGTIRLRMVSPIWSFVAEIDEARLVGMECESIPCKALAQNAEDPLGIEEVLERQHGIVSERIRVHLPVRRGRTSNSKHSSSTWCRKMFERQGEITPPCGEPSVAWRRRPSSRTPAFSHLSIIRRMTPSVTRRSRKSRRWRCEIESKYFSMSMSSPQHSLWLMQAVCRVCSA